VDIAGSSILTFGQSQEKRVVSYPIRDEQIKFLMLFYCCLAHPSIIIRADTLGKTLKFE
jgi:hypothetical protein